MIESPPQPEKSAFPEQVTPKKFCQILRQDKFLNALAIAADETSITGHETIFSIDITPENESKISGVRVGGLDQTFSTLEIAAIDGDAYIENQHASLFDFQFHPDNADVVIPSDTDLETLRMIRSSAMGIGQITDNRDIAILILIPKHKVVTDSDIETYQEIRDTEFDYESVTQERIQRALQECGIFTQVFRYKFNDKRCKPVLTSFPDESIVPVLKLTFFDPKKGELTVIKK